MKWYKMFLALLLSAATDVAMAQPYRVGVCDWMILKRQKLGEFALARRLGADGVELDMGSLGRREAFDNQLRDPAQAAHFRRTADSLGVKIGAMAMSGFFGQSLLDKDTYLELARDAFDTAERMGAERTVFLPLGGSPTGGDAARERELVKRLQAIGQLAAERGFVVGIEAPLTAKGYRRLLKRVGCPSVKVFYKWQTALELGADIAKDLEALGRDNIVAMHASNTDGVCLRDDKAINAVAIRRALDRMKWSGWLFVERSRDTTMVRNVTANYSNNVHYLKSVFAELPQAAVALDSAGRDTAYVRSILGRAAKVTDRLGITYTPDGQEVRNIVANRYFELNDIYAERDSVKRLDKRLAQAQCDSRLYRSHFAFDANLGRYLDEREIETVKDVMTFGVVKVTYDAHCDMIPSLRADEKQQILLWLKEARELAIDAESSKKKHEVFGKYKGRINNYLTRRGYDLAKERAAWYERVKARGGSL